MMVFSTQNLGKGSFTPPIWQCGFAMRFATYKLSFSSRIWIVVHSQRLR